MDKGVGILELLRVRIILAHEIGAKVIIGIAVLIGIRIVERNACKLGVT